MAKYKIILSLTLILIAIWAYAAPPQKQHQSPLMRWVSLSSDARDTVREIIRSEVESREGFSTSVEERTNLKAVEDEKERDDSDYKNSIIAASKEFIRAKKRRDDSNTQFQSGATDLEELAKSIKTIRTTIENLDGQVERYNTDIKAQQSSLNRWLQTEKQGEILVAVIYTRGFKDTTHVLESTADKASAPLIATHMGTYIQSFTKIINNQAIIDFIRATEEGTAKWNNEEPMRIELDKDVQGTTYLRIKRYELYPFQDNKSGKIKQLPPSVKYKVAIINSRKDLNAFLAANQYPTSNAELNRMDRLIRDTSQNNAAAEEGLNEQVKSFQDRITVVQNKTSSALQEKESQKQLLKRKEENYYKASLDVGAIRERKDEAERQFQQAQALLYEKKRVHESIIIKTALATTKGSQTPAEASAEAILDKLAEVKNDAKTQHSSSTTEVTNFRVSAESATQSITEARIIAVRLISFINEGDSVRVKMSFRVRTVLEEQLPGEEPVKTIAARPVTKTPEARKKTTVEPSTPPVTAPALQKSPKVIPFKRTYRPLGVKDALGCLFELRSVNMTKDGLRILVEVVNADADVRKVAFYDDKFGSWPRSKIIDEAGNNYPTNEAYVWQGSQKNLMADIDRRGRGVEIQPQTSVTMELIYKNVPAKVKTIKITLHPFIYYASGGRGENWQEFDLPMPDMRLKR